LDDLQDLWSTNEVFFSNLYCNVKECLTIVARRMNLSTQMARKVEDRCATFQALFGEDIMKQNRIKIVDSKAMSNQAKLLALQPYILPVIIHNFQYSFNLRVAMLKSFQDLILDIVTISDNEQIKIDNNDKGRNAIIYL
jgi:hypothetical protein